jgi:cholesterol oxidase
VVNTGKRLNNGVAISSVFQADEHTNIELCKFPDKSGLMMRLGALATGEGPPLVRLAKLGFNILRQPLKFLRTVFSSDLAHDGVVLLVMQNLDNAMRMIWKKRPDPGR